MVVAVIESFTEYLPLTARVSSSVTVPSFSRSFHGEAGLPPFVPCSKSSHTMRPAQSSAPPPAEPPLLTFPAAPATPPPLTPPTPAVPPPLTPAAPAFVVPPVAFPPAFVAPLVELVPPPLTPAFPATELEPPLPLPASGVDVQPVVTSKHAHHVQRRQTALCICQEYPPSGL